MEFDLARSDRMVIKHTGRYTFVDTLLLDMAEANADVDVIVRLDDTGRAMFSGKSAWLLAHDRAARLCPAPTSLCSDPRLFCAAPLSCDRPLLELARGPAGLMQTFYLREGTFAMRGSLLARAIHALDLVDIESQSINIETVRASLLFPLSPLVHRQCLHSLARARRSPARPSP